MKFQDYPLVSSIASGDKIMIHQASSQAEKLVLWDNSLPFVPTIAALRALPFTGFTTGRMLNVSGYYAPQDGAGGPIRVFSTGQPVGTYTDNGGSVIVPTGGDGSYAWLFSYVGAYQLKWFGVRGTGIDETTLVQAAFNATPAGGRLLVGPGTYGLTATITRSLGTIQLLGEGSGGLLGLTTFKALPGIGTNPLFTFTDTNGYSIIEEIGFDMNTIGGDTIYFTGSVQQFVSILSCRFSNNAAGYTHFHMKGTSGQDEGINSRIENCIFASGSLGSAIWLENVADRVTIRNNGIIVKESAFRLDAPPAAACVAFIGNNVYGSTKMIRVFGGQQFYAVNNQIEAVDVLSSETNAVFQIIGSSGVGETHRGAFIGPNNINGHNNADYAVYFEYAQDCKVEWNVVDGMLAGELYLETHCEVIRFESMRIRGGAGIGVLGPAAAQATWTKTTVGNEWEVNRPFRVETNQAGNAAGFFRNTSATGIGLSVIGGGSDNTHPFFQFLNSSAGLVAQADVQFTAFKYKIGYLVGVGAGGAVTQLTSKSTSVTLNKPTGQITMNNANLVAGVRVQFDVVSDQCEGADTIMVNHSSGGTSGAYAVDAHGMVGGGFKISVTNRSGGDLAEAIVLNYVIFKGSIN